MLLAIQAYAGRDEAAKGADIARQHRPAAHRGLDDEAAEALLSGMHPYDVARGVFRDELAEAQPRQDHDAVANRLRQVAGLPPCKFGLVPESDDPQLRPLEHPALPEQRQRAG